MIDMIIRAHQNIQDIGLRDIERRNAQLLVWKKWLPRVHDAEHRHHPLIQRMYTNNVIPKEKLLDLQADDPLAADSAREAIANEAGFLHPEVPNMRECTPPSGICKVLNNSEGHMIGFYTMLCETGLVEQQCIRDFGWQSDYEYTAENLPQRSATGKLTWKNPAIAAHVFNHLDQLALPGDLIIRQDDSHHRNAGKGKALKVAAYESLENREWALDPDAAAAKLYTITRIFEITKVGDRPLKESVVNHWSRHVNQDLGAMEIGTLTESFRRGGVPIEVQWLLYFSDVPSLLSRARSGAR
ncbi:MAG: hypothetical protein Greene041619_344 [Candidatus Peregrinibacteria bacterium Greene0416_19]|nr:MAG: hypothetical protein Greene041619_344 [Candidatus Peregrinibacteria bacterium Greene0416_19]